MKAVLLIGLLVNLGGCASQDKPAASAIQPATGIPMLDFALDTKTGQLCRTWPWEITDAKPGSRSEGINNIPQCFTLYTQYPDESEKAQSKSLDNEPIDAVKKAKEKPSSAPQTWDELKRQMQQKAQPQR
jgi:hypothetical protein